jgi:hypothetical protein
MWPFNVVERSPGNFCQSSTGDVHVSYSLLTDEERGGNPETGFLFQQLLNDAGIGCKVTTEISSILHGNVFTLLLTLNLSKIKVNSSLISITRYALCRHYLSVKNLQTMDIDAYFLFVFPKVNLLIAYIFC